MNPMNAMNAEGWSEFFSGIVALSWRTGWLVVALVALRFVVRGRIPAQVWFAVWIVVALRLLLPFSVPVAWSPFDLTIGQAAVVTVERVAEQDAAAKWARVVAEPTVITESVSATVEANGVAVAAPWSWQEVAMAVWLGGVVGLGGLRLVASWIFRGELRKARRVTDGRWSAMVVDEAKRAGLGTKVLCLETEAVEAPAVCGWLRPLLLFPAGFAEKLTDDELRFVVRHELGHWRRRDLIAQALMQTAVVLHWFNPLVWVAERLARTDCELACDEFVLRREADGGASAYGTTLLKVLGVVGGGRRPLAVVGILENRRQLAERVRMIADYQRAGFGRMIGGVALVAMVAVVSAMRESRAEQPAVTPRTQAAVAVQVLDGESVAAAATAEQARVKEERARIENARKAFDGLSATVAAQRKKVEELADSLLAYKEKNNLGTRASRDEQQKLLAEKTQAAVLEQRSARAALTEAEIRSRQWTEYREGRATLESLSTVANDAGAFEAMRNLKEKKRAAEALGWTGVKARPEAFAEQGAIANAEAEVERASWAVTKQIEATYQTAWSRAERAQIEYQRLYQEETDFERRMLTYTKLERELKLSEQILRSITMRARETAMLGVGAAPSAVQDLAKLGQEAFDVPKREPSSTPQGAVPASMPEQLRPKVERMMDAKPENKGSNNRLLLDQRRVLQSESLHAANLELVRSQQAFDLAENRLQQLRDFRNRNEDPQNLTFISSQPLVAQLRQRLIESNINLATARDRYLPGHPKMLHATTTRSEVEKELAAAVQAAVVQVEAEFEAANRQRVRMEEQVKRRMSELAELERGELGFSSEKTP